MDGKREPRPYQVGQKIYIIGGPDRGIIPAIIREMKGNTFRVCSCASSMQHIRTSDGIFRTPKDALRGMERPIRIGDTILTSPDCQFPLVYGAVTGQGKEWLEADFRGPYRTSRKASLKNRFGLSSFEDLPLYRVRIPATEAIPVTLSQWELDRVYGSDTGARSIYEYHRK